jgi:hypothetical protein
MLMSGALQLEYRGSPRLPRLAWCAAVDRQRARLVVHHGLSVETHARFFVEGGWNGDFGAGDFASTECIFGSGATVSGRGVTFVTSCSTTDSLFYVLRDGRVLVSNSLPFLLAAAGDELDASYGGYCDDCESVIRGINNYHRYLPTAHGAVRRLLFRNLLVTSGAVEEVDKPRPPGFRTYEEYVAYLEEQYRLIAANLRSPDRRERVEILSTQSRGYDTTAVNAIASRHGIARVFTSRASKSRDPFGEHRNRGFQNDDGSEICRALGLECVPIDRRFYERSGFPDEHLYYASQPGNQDANLLEINTHVRQVSVLLTGVLGEIWRDAAYYASTPCDLTPDLRRGDTSGHGLSEIRLRVGFTQVALPFLGAQQREAIYRISNSPEMDAWRINPAYDRPIPRRIAEARGVPRSMFGQVKMGSVVLWPSPRLPQNRQLREEFVDALVDAGVIYRWQTNAWPAVHVVNTILEWRSETRFRAVHYVERALTRLRGRRLALGPLWSHLNGSLFWFCVNKSAREYADAMRVTVAAHRSVVATVNLSIDTAGRIAAR